MTPNAPHPESGPEPGRGDRVVAMDAEAVRLALSRMAREVVERAGGTERLVLMGIRRRGVELAERIRDAIEDSEGIRVPFGILDITMYRDDLQEVGIRPEVGETELPIQGVEGRVVVLVDDVVFTGRTIRAALNELMDWGRPARILLCALVDRGGRELPIHPDIVGRHMNVLPHERVEVLVPEEDGRLAVELSR
jgi:pyrimidine operon attenuation protein / uracil phosphoribosyltransferase